jgi:hypothetical protein
MEKGLEYEYIISTLMQNITCYRERMQLASLCEYIGPANGRVIKPYYALYGRTPRPHEHRLPP